MMVEPSAHGVLGERLAERLGEPSASRMVEPSAHGATHLHRHRIGNYAFAVNIRMASHGSEGGRRAFLVQPASL
jgi:hypothetical protein